MDSLITLVAETFTTDAIGQRIPSESYRQVWAHVQSASRSEWFQAGQSGLRPSLVADTQLINYNGEKTVVVYGKRYSVYRTYYNEESDSIELYLEERIADVQR